MTYENSRRFVGTPADAKLAAKPSQAVARPRAEQAISATFWMAHVYGMGSQFDTGRQEDTDRYPAADLPDEEVRRRLVDLARGIEDGLITSHGEVAGVILGLGANIGLFGAKSHESNEAAFRAARAIRLHRTRFTDDEEFTARIAALRKPQP